MFHFCFFLPFTEPLPLAEIWPPVDLQLSLLPQVRGKKGQSNLALKFHGRAGNASLSWWDSNGFCLRFATLDIWYGRIHTRVCLTSEGFFVHFVFPENSTLHCLLIISPDFLWAVTPEMSDELISSPSVCLQLVWHVKSDCTHACFLCWGVNVFYTSFSHTSTAHMPCTHSKKLPSFVLLNDICELEGKRMLQWKQRYQMNKGLFCFCVLWLWLFWHARTFLCWLGHNDLQ